MFRRHPSYYLHLELSWPTQQYSIDSLSSIFSITVITRLSYYHRGSRTPPPNSVANNGKIWLTFTPCIYVPSLCQGSCSHILQWLSVNIVVCVNRALPTMGNLALANVLSSCLTLNDHPLNTSDHLPITLKLDPSFSYVSQPSLPFFFQNSTGSFLSLSDDLVKPLMNKEYSCIDELDKDFALVCKSLEEIAVSTIPNFKAHAYKYPRISLSTLCWKSRVAYQGCWVGQEYDNRKKAKIDVSSYFSKCRARLDRIKIQKRDEMFSL